MAHGEVLRYWQPNLRRLYRIGYPIHSPVSLSLPLPCVTVCHHSSTGLCRNLSAQRLPECTVLCQYTVTTQMFSAGNFEVVVKWYYCYYSTGLLLWSYACRPLEIVHYLWVMYIVHSLWLVRRQLWLSLEILWCFTQHGVDENMTNFIAVQKSVNASCEFQVHVVCT